METALSETKAEMLSAEMRLLLCCASADISPRATQQLKTLLKEPIDWPVITNLARRHALLPLLFKALNKVCPEQVPSEVLKQLRQQFQASTQRSLLLSMTLVHLVQDLTAAGILVVPFKGPALAAAAYQDLGSRQFNDLDLIVRLEDLNRARDWFLSQGYEMKFEHIKPTSAQVDLFIRSRDVHRLVRECTYPFVHPQQQILIELHWAVMPNIIPFPMEPQKLWANLSDVTIAQSTIPHFSPEATLILLCAHGAKDCWIQLSRLCDVAMVLHQYPDMDWNWMLQWSKEIGVQRLVFLGLALAHELLDVSLPDLVQQALLRDKAILTLVNRVKQQLGETASYSIGAKSPFHIAVRERWQDRWQYRLRSLLLPTTSDWLMWPLAKFPRGLYVLLRPLRLMAKLLRR